MSPITVIVGGSVGGVRTAQALRGADYAGRVVLLVKEDRAPYDKPPLSKALLAGSATLDDLTLLSPTEADRLGIEVRLGTEAVALDAVAHEVVVAGGKRIGYDSLVIATGAEAKCPPWWPMPGVHVVRTADDAIALRADLDRGGPLLVVGAGFIGAEVAATARAKGVPVTLVDPLPAPMSRVLSEEIGGYFADLHRRNGVRTRFGAAVERLDRDGEGLRAILTDGRIVDAATVVVGIGAEPVVTWLSSSGVRLDDGVICDGQGRCEGVDDVFAVGDVARWWHPRHGDWVRVEHWTNAAEQAVVVARALAGGAEDSPPHAPVEYVWSDQYDWKIQIAGRMGAGSRHEMLGSVADNRFAVLFHDGDDLLTGLLTVNWPRVTVAGRRTLAQSGTLTELRSRLEGGGVPART
ncbi:FAD/NAD(P)-binding oxidoreductase [Amycolatopsis sp.]|uniref:NAD(P)/FAD-dependent oxidoreductase n=1 Tax=Amycolatopsis sp. TaxID=37632 RepID=UPI002BE8C955|nr:FAD/NAD(P)-binding oxidoreductase [Amycolatopsis sp.]HVV11890.1 FAD/NAD(P)-binding oxidoreductase [Amycolatopsis sp.]